MAGDGGFLADVARFPELAGAVAEGARSLDEAAAGMPGLPNAGASTVAVGEAMGELAELVGLLVGAMASTGHGVTASGGRYRQVDRDAAGRLPDGGGVR